MAGVGPPPKSPGKRVGHSKDRIAGREVSFLPVEPHDLPGDLLPDGEEWHTATLRWWKRWCESPLAENLPEVDWSELESCAVLHHEFMRKRSFTLGSELRLRMAKFGATPEDRQRLRIITTTADEKDPGQKPAGSSARERMGALRALPPITG